MNQKKFKSSLFLRMIKGDYNPFTPNIIKIYEKKIEYRRRNSHLFSVDSNSVHFQNVIGVDVDKHFLGASIIINTNGTGNIQAGGFSKKRADEIASICSEHINESSYKGNRESIHQHQNTSKKSISDELRELKQLVDDDIITREEFDRKKHQLLNQ